MRWSVFPASRSEARHAVGATSLLSLTVQTCGVSRIFDLDPDKVDQFCENLAVSHQSLGLRSMTFNVGSLDELDRIESVLRGRDLFNTRQQIAGGVSELVRGRDPDNLPLVFAYYAHDGRLGPDYYRTVVNLAYSLDA